MSTAAYGYASPDSFSRIFLAIQYRELISLFVSPPVTGRSLACLRFAGNGPQRPKTVTSIALTFRINKLVISTLPLLCEQLPFAMRRIIHQYASVRKENNYFTGNLTSSSFGFFFLKSDTIFLSQAAKIPSPIATIMAKAPYKNGNSLDSLRENSAYLLRSV